MTDDVDATSFEPIPAQGIGAERFDRPALFYMTHQAVIDEWYALRKTVVDAFNDWMETTIREALAAIANDRDLGLSPARGPHKYRNLLVHPRTMPIINTRPIVGVGIAWSPTGSNPVSNPPFVCVRRSSITPGKVAASALLEAGGREFRSRENLKGRDDDVWPVYSYIQGHSRWWTDLDAYRSKIVGDVERYADGLKAALDAAAAAGEAVAAEVGMAEDEPEDV